MEKRILLSFPKRLFLLTAISLFLLGGFLFHPRRTSSTSVADPLNGTHYYTLTNPDDFKLKKIQDVIFPVKVDGSAVKVFLADCRGDEQIEVIIVGSTQLLIYSFDGKLLLHKRLTEDNLRPAFAHDTDGDGKADIVFGTEHARTNAIKILNGMGFEISRFTEKSATQNFSALIPKTIYRDQLIAIAQPEGYSSPRGILLLDAFSLELEQTFFTPYPIDLTLLAPSRGSPAPLLIPSYRVFDEGQFQSYGPSDKPRDEVYEAKRMLLKIDTAEMISEEFELLDTPDADSGTIRYAAIPEVPERVLLFFSYPSEHMHESVTHVYEVSLSDGVILNRREQLSGVYHESRIIPVSSSSYLIIAALQRQNGTALTVFSRDLEILKSFELPNSLEFGPFFFDPVSSKSVLFLILEDGLYGINNELELLPVLKEKGFLKMAVYQSSDSLFTALLTESGLELFVVSKILHASCLSSAIID